MAQPTPAEILLRASVDQSRARLNPATWNNAVAGIANKQAEVARAQEEKISALRAAVDRDRIAEQSWAGQLGLERGGIPHTVVNIAASAAAATTEAIGSLGSVGFDAAAATLDAGIPQNVYEANSRFEGGTATPEDMALLHSSPESKAQPVDTYAAYGLPAPATPAQTVPSYLNQIHRADAARNTATHLNNTFDTSSIVDQRNRFKLSGELGIRNQEGLAKLKEASAGWDENKLDATVDFISGAADLILNAGQAAMENPMAFAEYTAEMVPDLLLGAASKSALAVRNIGYGIESYRTGIENYKTENNGAMPDEGTRRWMLMNALGSAALEMTGDVTLLGAAGKAAELIDPASILRRAARVGKEAAIGTVSEATTEGLQTVMEGQAKLDPATGAQIYESMVIGGGVGGAVATPLAAVTQASEAAQGLRNASQLRTVEANKKALVGLVQNELVKKAEEAGDVTELTDPKNTDVYHPGKAAAALRARAQNMELTEEQRTEATQKMDAIVSGLETQLSEAKAAQLLGTPEAIAAKKADLAATEAIIAAGKETPARLELFKLKAANLVEAIKKLEDPKSAADLAAELNRAEQFLTIARQENEMVIGRELPQGDDVEALVTQMESPEDTPERAAANSSIISLAMADPTRLTPVVLDRILNTESTVLTQEDRTLLQKTADAMYAVDELKDTESVHANVLNGDADFRGLTAYVKSMGQALFRKQQSVAQRQLEMLGMLKASHEGKAAAFAKGIAMMEQAAAKGNKSSLYLLKDTEAPGGWKISNTLTVAGSTVKAKPEFTFGAYPNQIAGASKVKSYVDRELKAIGLTLDQMDAGYARTFNGKTVEQVKAPVKQQEKIATAEVVVEAPVEKVAPPAAEKKTSTTTPKVVEPAADTNSVVESETAVEVTQTSKTNKLVAALEQAMAALGDDDSIDPNVKTHPELFKAEELAFNNLRAEIQRLITRMQAFGAEEPNRLQERLDELAYAPDDTSSDDLLKLYNDTIAYAKEVNKTQGNLFDNKVEVPPAQEIDPVDTEIAALLREQETALEDTTESQAETTEETNTEAAPALTVQGNAKQGDYQNPKKVNLLDYFFQPEPKEGNKSVNPLVSVANFLSEVTNGKVDVAEWLGNKLSDEQGDFLGLFYRYAREWNGAIFANTNMPKPSPAHFYKDPVQYKMEYLEDDKGNIILNEDGVATVVSNIPENWATAISYAAFSWLSEDGDKVGFNNDDKQINRILRRSKDIAVWPTERAVLWDAGIAPNLLIPDLGQRIFNALGFKVRPDAPLNEVEKFKSALGNHALVMMIQSGFVERQAINMADLPNRSGDTGDSDIEMGSENVAPPSTAPKTTKTKMPRYSPFIRPVRVDGVLSNQVKGMVNSRKGTQSVLDKLFSVEPSLKIPSFVPTKWKQEFAAKTRKLIPKAMQPLMKFANEQPNKIRTDMQKVRRSISQDTLESIVGIIDTVNTFVHGYDLKGVEASNEASRRELNNLDEFEGIVAAQPEGMDSKFYLTPAVQRHQRVGYQENMVNPQSSTIHRRSMYLENSATEIDALADKEAVALFKLAIAQGMGIPVDKMNPSKALEKLELLMETSEVGLAVAALINAESLPDGKLLTSEEQNAIAAAVKKGKEKLHSLDALVHWAKYTKAVSHESDNKFTSTIIFEVDGVANGPSFAHILMGVVSEARGKMFGFFKESVGVSSYPEWKSLPGTQDLYEETMSAIIARLAQSTHEGKLDYLGAVKFFTGNLGDEQSVSIPGRKLIKQPTTGIVFGGGAARAASNMGEHFVDLFYAQLTKAANGAEFSLADVVRNANLLLPKGMQLIAPKTEEGAMGLYLSDDQRDHMKAMFADLVGENVEATMKQNFGEFMKVRNILNSAAQEGWTLYNTAFEYYRYQRIQEKVKLLELPHASNQAGDKRALQDLTPEEIDAIRAKIAHLDPTIHTAMSSAEKDKSAGLQLGKLSRGITEKNDLPYRADTNMGVQYEAEIVGGKKKLTTSIKSSSTKIKDTDPGVGTIIMGVHSMESAISMNSYGTIPALNVHDSNGFGVKHMMAGAMRMNEMTFHYLANYSLPMEILDSYLNTVAAANELAAEDPALAEAFSLAMVEVNKRRITLMKKEKRTFEQLLGQTAVDAENNKLTFLLQQDYVNQYAMVNGMYTITADDRKMLLLKIAQLKEKATSFGVYKFTPPRGAKQKPGVNSTAWGELGTPAVDSSWALTQYLKTATNPTLKGILPVLMKHIQDIGLPPQSRDFQMALLRQLNKVVDGDIPIIYITADSDIPVPAESNFTSARGGYYVEKIGGKEVIYIKSPEFSTSGVTSETMLHELVHAAVAQIIAKSPGLAPVKELVKLMELARLKVEETGTQDKYGKIVTDIQEFVAWGMTNIAFQTEILGAINMEPGNAKALEKTGMRRFIEKLVEIVFRGSKATDAARKVNGMAILIGNVSLLMDEQKKTLGATKKMAISLNHQDPAPLHYTTMQVFDALAGSNSTSLDFNEHLRSMLASISNVAYGPFGALKAAAERKAPMGAEDVFLESLRTGKLPFASAATGQLKLSDKELFTLESIEVTVRETLGNSQLAQREIAKIYREAKQAMSAKDFHVGDWATATQAEKQRAEKTYAFVFTPQQGADGTSDYLSRFTAIGLAYPPMYAKLATIRPKVGLDMFKGKSLMDRLDILVKLLLQSLAYVGTLTSHKQNSAQRLKALAERLAKLEAKRKAQLIVEQNTVPAAYEKALERAGESVRKAIVDTANAPSIKNNSVALVRVAGKLTSAVASGTVGTILDGIRKLRNKQNFQERDGTTAALLGELQGVADKDISLLKLLRASKQIEQARAKIDQTVSGQVGGGFAEPLSEIESSAVTRAFVRTDIASLIKEYSMEQLAEFLKSPKSLEKAITALAAKLTGPDKVYYQNRAQDLGDFLSEDIAGTPNLQFNAYNIAHRLGTARYGKVDAQIAADNIPVIDKLASLYALYYLPDSIKKPAHAVLTRELARADKHNGIELVLKLHADLQNDAKENLFAEGMVHYMKGYTKEIFNPHIEVEVATLKGGEKLLMAGWIKVGKLEKDDADARPDDYFIYTRRDGGGAPRVSGALSITGQVSRGTSTHGGITSATGEFTYMGNVRKNQAIARAQQKGIAALDSPRQGFARVRSKKPVMVPVFSPTGTITAYRYLMSATMKDDLLGRDNRVDRVLGRMSGHTFDKINSAPQNELIIETLHSKYKQEFAKDPEAFVEFSEDSADPEVANAYRLLPSDAKRHINKIWGVDRMMINADAYNMMIGYRKYKASAVFDKDETLRTAPEKIAMGIASFILWGDKTGMRAKFVEQGWQTIMGEVKDFFVVKSLSTMLGNNKFNMVQLAAMGVPVKDIIRDHITAFIGIFTYQMDEAELDKLKNILRIKYVQGDTAAIEARIVELEDSLKRNPVRPLVEAGLYHTIAEDIDTSEDLDAYKNKLGRFTEKVVARLPDKVRAIGEGVYMTHDTTLYQLLSRGTHAGDFMARYTLYKHATTRTVDKLDHAAAVELADKSFVNYDIPTDQKVQYINDMGIIPFTKYYLRMQSVLFAIYHDKPGRVLALAALNNVTSIVPSITDPVIWEWLLRNPAGAGPFNYVDAIQEGLTVKALDTVL